MGSPIGWIGLAITGDQQAAQLAASQAAVAGGAKAQQHKDQKAKDARARAAAQIKALVEANPGKGVTKAATDAASAAAAVVGAGAATTQAAASSAAAAVADNSIPIVLGVVAVGVIGALAIGGR